MNDIEFDVLDELYFIKTFDEILSSTQLDSKELRVILMRLFDKGWIRCYRSASDEVIPEEVDIELDYMKYLYLASKTGLIAHNS
ncbi:MAG: hypothetical protein O2887_10700 [Bacteroidetes bacterium]|nr:hypothetical protein [Bacteroidota bacterium]MDA1120939.1 hypothetical protein [Bacteroidota bacterium]